ncbi:MAG: lysine--tRNA ligase [Spirochaetes bacterium]|nr:lysine--tRNA ligase [Spirochaetota bacterium]
MAQLSDERDIRIEKLNSLLNSKINPYPDRCNITHSLKEALSVEIGTRNIEIAGRLMLKRLFGKLIFATLQDFSGRLQIALSVNDLNDEKFKFFQKMVDVGDFVYAKGEIIKTHKGEITLNVSDFNLLSKAIRPLPEKFHGLTDLEARSRQRYLDMVMNNETIELFKKRIKTIQVIRAYLEKNNFYEVETPVLQSKPSGAMAKPFKTHHNALDIDLFMRIAPETYLKRCIAGGFEKVFEFARCFRNEGMDPSHLQEFTLLEYYCAYWNYEDNMKFTEKLIKHILKEINGTLELEYKGIKINFNGEWPKYSFRDLIIKYTDIDIDKHPDKESLINAIKEKNIELEEVDFKKISRGNLIDQLYKKTARPNMIQPQFLIHHPIDLSPLARKNDKNPQVTDRFQLVVNTWEIVNAYSELIDPLDQRERLLQQAEARKKGDEEAMIMEEDFILCMEYGMPPISGWGMGIDRFIALLTNQENLRDVVLFPLMRPVNTEKTIAEKKEKKGETKEINKNKNQESVNTGVVKPKDIPDIKVDKDILLRLFREKVTSDHLIHHSLATAAVLRGVARRFKLNESNYYYLGLVHDIDFDIVEDMTLHGKVGAGWLKDLGIDEYFLHAVMAHNEEGTKVKKETFADFALCCSESVTGLISACAKVYPDKKVASVAVKSVTKRMKEKAFAAKVNRDFIRLCEKIGLPLEEFIEIALKSMTEIANEIGL